MRHQPRAKSLFRHLFLIFTFALTTYAAVQLLRSMQPLLSWFGLFMAAGAPMFFLVLSFVRPAAKSQQLSVATGAISGLGLAITMAMNWRYGDASGAVHLWAGACLIAWLLNLRWAER